jgi:NAD(P)-dependent dehydrogenase (short-subunit alcohol dehydrogenase family)
MARTSRFDGAESTVKSAPLSDHVVILTGASEGIGRALALALAPQRLLLELARECEAAGSAALAVPTDVTSEAQCRALIDAAVARFGRIDVLVNNAGGTMWSRFDALADWSIFEPLMRLNYLSSVYLTGFALPWLKQTQGRIVAVASMAGLTGVPERSAYAATKHAMVGFFDSLRIELEGSGVTVTVIAPDFVRSEIHKRALGPDGRPLGESPMRQERIMSAEDCARLMVRAIEKRQRLLVTSARGRFGRWLKLIAPRAIDRIAARAIRERH